MQETIGILAGLLLGLLSGLIPGFHLATLVTIGLGVGFTKLLEPQAVALMIASGAGVTLYTRHLSHTYHPTPASQLDYASPTVKLAYAGRGRDALALLSLSTWYAAVPTLLVSFVLVLVGAAGATIGKVPASAAIGVILVWVYATVRRAKHKVLTVIGFLAAALYGYAATHHPAIRGSEHALSPMLAGLFALPGSFVLLWESRHKPADFPRQRPVGMPFVSQHLAYVGAALGMLSGFMAGLGSGSAVASLGDLASTEEDYIFMHAGSETANDLLSIGLALSVGLGRSGEAAAMNAVLHQPPLSLSLAILLTLCLGMVVGKHSVTLLANHYINLVTRTDARYMAGFVILAALVSAFLAAQWFGILLALAGIGIALFLRLSYVPAQVSLAALAAPVLAYHLGFVPSLNGLLF